MNRAGTLMWLGGTECELRPVTAVSYFSAKKEASELSEKYGDDAESMYILRGACLVALGAYANGEKMFSSGEDVLEKLSAKEIISASSEYAVSQPEIAEETPAEEATSAKAADEHKEDTFLQMTAAVLPEKEITTRTNTEREIQYRVREKTEAPEEVQNAFSETTNELPEYSRRPQLIAYERPLEMRKTIFSNVSEMYSYSSEPVNITNIAHSGDAEYVSDFFERDCRRYDGAFEKY